MLDLSQLRRRARLIHPRQAAKMVGGATEKPGGVDPSVWINSVNADSIELLLVDVALDSVAPNEAGDRYDGTVDPDRARLYAQRRAEDAPPVILRIAQRSGDRCLRVVDGGHRVSAARLRGDASVRAIVLAPAPALSIQEVADPGGADTTNVTVLALRGGATVGTLTYSAQLGVPTVSMVQVREDVRRQGIGSRLMKHVQSQFPGTQVLLDGGATTREGAWLYASLPKQIVAPGSTGAKARVLLDVDPSPKLGISIDGVLRPQHNDQGFLISDSFEGLQAFWRWFESSDAIDQMGRPVLKRWLGSSESPGYVRLRHPEGEGEALGPRSIESGQILLADDEFGRVTRQSVDQAIRRKLDAWFAGSRIELGGRPLLVYNGSAQWSGELSLARCSDLGFHVGTRHQALHFAQGVASRVRSFVAQIRNPVILGFDTFGDRVSDAQDTIWALGKAAAFDSDTVERLIGLSRAFVDEQSGDLRAAARQIWAVTRQALIDRGFDGVAYQNQNEREGCGWSFVVFDPQAQLVSATRSSDWIEARGARSHEDENGQIEGVLASEATSSQLVQAFHGSWSKAKPPMDVGLGVHFGSFEQAVARLHALPSGEQPTIWSVELNVPNCLRLDDLGTWQFSNVMRELGSLSALDRDEADAIWDGWNRSDDSGWQALRQALQRKGWQAIVYANKVEGAGDSYLVFDESCVRWIEASLPDTVMVDGVARPTRNSQGKPIHALMEGVEKFWRWFGESPFVDEMGRPQVIYRGEGSGDERWTYDIDDTRFGGIFLTWDHRTASMYERPPPGSLRGEMGQPREFYVRAGRTLDLTRDTRHNRAFVAQWAKSFEEWVDRRSGEEIDPWDLVESGSMHEYEGTMKPERWIDLVATSLIDHDALVAFDLHGGTPVSVVVVRGDSQIKSATFNVGSFSTKSNDIRFSDVESWSLEVPMNRELERPRP